MIMPRSSSAMTRARASGLARMRAPQIRCVSSSWTAITTTMTGVRWMTKSLKLRLRGRADDDVRRIADQGRRAADIRGEHLGEQKRIGRHLRGHG